MLTSKEKSDTKRLPMMPIREVVIFPYRMPPFVVGRESSVRSLEEEIRYKTSADDAHPGGSHLSVHDDAVRGGAGIQCARARRSHGGGQEDFPGGAARRFGGRAQA